MERHTEFIDWKTEHNKGVTSPYTSSLEFQCLCRYKQDFFQHLCVKTEELE